MHNAQITINESNFKRQSQDCRIVIIGAGAAGLMAAGTVENCLVTVLERNEKPGKKLYITGKGRCNVTNDCSPEEFSANVVGNPKFLYSCIHGFTPSDTIAMLNACGVRTKVERGKRVFPQSDKSSDVIHALYNRAIKNNARFVFNQRVKTIESVDDKFVIVTDSDTYRCDKLLIATGGKSYPATGSEGDGYAFAKHFSHTIVQPKPALVPLIMRNRVTELAGLTLKNVTASIAVGKKTYKEFGELLFTHEGMSGPVILRLSSYISRAEFPLKLYIDLKPSLDEDTLDKRITRDFSEVTNKQLKNTLDKLLPKAIINPVILQSRIEPDKKINTITKQERKQLVYAIKNLCYDITDTDSFANAVITSGGVSTKEVDPKTMESKLKKNLYFAGEILDVDALTGGFNLQIAFSTAYAAAKAMSGTEEL